MNVSPRSHIGNRGSYIQTDDGHIFEIYKGGVRNSDDESSNPLRVGVENSDDDGAAVPLTPLYKSLKSDDDRPSVPLTPFCWE